MWYMWHGGIVAGRAQGIAPTMLRSHPQTCSSIVFPLPKVGIRGGEVCGHGGACLRHADLQQPCLSGGGRYAAEAMLIYPMYVYKIEVVS